MISQKILQILEYDFINSKVLHKYMIKNQFRLSIYRILAWNILFTLFGMIIISAGFIAMIFNMSLIHNPENNFRNGISCLLFNIIFSSPLWILFLYKIFFELYINKKNKI